MVTEVEFLIDIATVLGIAAVVTVIFKRIKQPVVFGYLVAGIIIGPFTPPFSYVHDIETIRLLAELGLIMLLFSLGLEFNIRKLRQVGFVSILAGTVEMIVMIAIGYYLGQALGWSDADSIFLGAILSISSTAIILKAITSLNKMSEKSSQIMFGMLVIEDLGAIVLLTILSGIGTEALSFLTIGETLGRIALFIFVFLSLGVTVIPRVITYIDKLQSDEVLIVSVLGLAFSTAFFTYYLGFSTATGAFLIGAVIAESRIIGKITHLMNPIRDVFASIFFVTIGMLFDISIITVMAIPILIITVVTIVGKIASCGAGVILAGHDGKTAMRVGMGMAQLGEFSFIIAKVGQDLKLASPFLYPIAVFVSVVTTILTPYFIRAAPVVSDRMSGKIPGRLRLSVGYYSSWTEKMRESLRTGRRATIRKITMRIVVNLIILALISVVTQAMFSNSAFIAEQFNIEPSTTSSVIWIVGAFLSVLPILRLSFAASDLVNVLSSTGALANLSMSKIIRRILAIFIITILLMILIPLLPLFETAAPSVSILSMLIIGSIGFLFRDKIHNISLRLERLFASTFEGRAGEEADDDRGERG